MGGLSSSSCGYQRDRVRKRERGREKKGGGEERNGSMLRIGKFKLKLFILSVFQLSVGLKMFKTCSWGERNCNGKILVLKEVIIRA